MIDPLTLSIGIGLVFGLVFVEAFGLFAGGMVVPGYIALDLVKPGFVLLTILSALLINVVIRLMSRYFVIYGRRRVSLTVLLAYLIGAFINHIFGSTWLVNELGGIYKVIGYIIPGLIALSIDRQGIIETLSTLLTVAVAVRLVLIILIGPVLLQ
jgi:poly-gamma-glutamate biosynthesis protein PgsC/CapC